MVEDSTYLADWEFHPATGMMSVYSGRTTWARPRCISSPWRHGGMSRPTTPLTLSSIIKFGWSNQPRELVMRPRDRSGSIRTILF